MAKNYCIRTYLKAKTKLECIEIISRLFEECMYNCTLNISVLLNLHLNSRA